MSTQKVFGIITGRAFGWPSGALKSAAGTNSRCVLGSRAMVLERGRVVIVPAGVYLSADSCLNTATVPSPHEQNTNFVSGSNAPASTPSPIGAEVTTFPVSVESTTSDLLRHPTNRRPDLVSMARLTGVLAG